MTARGVFCAVAVALVVAAPAARGRQSADDDLIKKARAIHDKVITLDTHVDINPADFTAERNYTQRLDTQVNLPKMVEGGLDAVFLIVYVGQPSLQSTPDAFEPSRLRARLQGGDREVRRHPPAHRDHRARQDRPRAHRGRRPPHRRERQEGRAHRRRERLSARHQTSRA